MNLYKKDYKKLYGMQNNFLDWWKVYDSSFYLTGGTALGRFYLNHRYSEDLDFFVNADPDFSKKILDIKNNLQSRCQTDISQTLITEDFARFFLEIDDLPLKIEFVNDVKYRPDQIKKTEFGNVDTVTNILANKLTAIVGRDEPKDIFDIVSLAISYSFNWEKIFNHAKEKAMINEIDVEQRLISFPVQNMNNVDWLIKPFNEADFEAQIRNIADDFLLGKDNCLGYGKINIENAEIVFFKN